MRIAKRQVNVIRRKQCCEGEQIDLLEHKYHKLRHEFFITIDFCQGKRRTMESSEARLSIDTQESQIMPTSMNPTGYSSFQASVCKELMMIFHC